MLAVVKAGEKREGTDGGMRDDQQGGGHAEDVDCVWCRVSGVWWWMPWMVDDGMGRKRGSVEA